MAYYKICPECGCALDPGERCDCEDKKELPMMTQTSQATKQIEI